MALLHFLFLIRFDTTIVVGTLFTCSGMSELPHQICLRELQPYLVRNMKVRDCLHHVIATGCLTDEEEQHIDHVMITDIEKMNRFITVLRQKEEKAFEALLKGLKQKSFNFVCKELEKNVEAIRKNPEQHPQGNG